MSYRVVTICIEKEENAELLTSVVANLTGAATTRVQTIHVMPSGMDYLSMSPYVQAVPLNQLYQKYEDIAAKVKNSYEQKQTKHPQNISWDWHQYDGNSLFDFTPYIDHALASDLVVCAKPPKVELGSALVKALVTESTTPVLVVPENLQQQTEFKRILVAWNETPEAARAIRDALPLLKRAELVVLVSVVKSVNEDSIKGSEMGRYLGEHGIQIEIDQRKMSETPGSELLQHVSGNYMDLLVMGGYGHSSLYHMAFGAATPHVLKELSCPVFLSH